MRKKREKKEKKEKRKKRRGRVAEEEALPQEELAISELEQL